MLAQAIVCEHMKQMKTTAHFNFDYYLTVPNK